MGPVILVVDDEPHIRDVVCYALEKAGMQTHPARDGNEALKFAAQRVFDLIVLDIGLPGMDGLEICRQVRENANTPILFLTARDEEVDRILGLEIGGDDYVTKPFSPRELAARVKTILRRTAPAPEMRKKDILHGPYRASRATHLVEFNGQPVDLTRLEFSLFLTLVTRPRQVFTREQLIDGLYGPGHHVTDHTIDSHIRNIRAKFTAMGCNSAIVTVRGIGFRLGMPETVTP